MCSNISYDSVLMPLAANLFAAAGLLIVCTACASAPQQSGVGKLTVGVTATGASSSNLVLKVVVEPAGISGSVKADAGVFTTGVVPLGTHLVRLTGVPAQCRVDGEVERKITITEQARFAVLRFALRCN